MTRSRPLLAVLAVAMVTAAACSARAQGPDIVGPDANTPFCKAIAPFRGDTGALNGISLRSDPTGFDRALALVRDDVLKLQDASPPPQFKPDLQTVAAGFDRMRQVVAGAKGDPQAVVQAVTAFAQDPQVTAAADRLNTYAHTRCGLNTEGNPPPSTTSTGSSTTVGNVVGPALPSATTTTG
jgi:hypothetical protein